MIREKTEVGGHITDNRGSAQDLTFVYGRSADELLAKLEEIRVPFSYVSIYGMNNRHYAWIRTERAIKKKVIKKENK